jgi:hypothetical protein
LPIARLGHLFRYLPHQPGHHKRLRAAAPLLAAAISHLARVSPSWCDDLRLLDATPLPCGASRETVRRSDIAGSGGYGYCASHSRFYWGLKLYMLTSGDGMPITWCLADPELGEREVCLDLLTTAVETGLLAPGTTVLADKGLAGREIETQIAALGVTMLRPDRRDEPSRHGSLGGIRQWVESVYDTLKGQLGLRTPRHTHPTRGLHPSRPAPARPGHRDLAQLEHRRPRQAQPHRLRPLNTNFTESII